MRDAQPLRAFGSLQYLHGLSSVDFVPALCEFRPRTTQLTLERGFEVDRRCELGLPCRWGSNLYPDVAGSGDKKAKAKLCRLESDEVAVAFGPPA